MLSLISVTVLLCPAYTAEATDTETAAYSVRHFIVSPDGNNSRIFLETNHTAPLGEKTSAVALNVPGCKVRAFAQKYTMSDRTVQVSIKYDVVQDIDIGDVNADGIVDLVDAALLNRFLAGWTGYGYEAVNPYFADINGDRELNAADARNMLLLLLGKEIEAEDGPWSPWV